MNPNLPIQELRQRCQMLMDLNTFLENDNAELTDERAILMHSLSDSLELLAKLKEHLKKPASGKPEMERLIEQTGNHLAKTAKMLKDFKISQEKRDARPHSMEAPPSQPSKKKRSRGMER